MTTKIKTTFSKQTKKLLNDSGIKKEPVPIERIANKLGAQLRYSPLDDEISGMVYIKEGTPIIGINSLHHPNRQRFTLSHETAHLILHKNEITKEIHVDKEFPMLMRDSVSSSGKDRMEIEANAFAAELLMPEEFLIKALGGKGFDIDDDEMVNKLAKQFKVSKSAMRFRLGKLFS